MDANELIAILKRGEDSKLQFKETVKYPGKLADEMVAFTNSQGGSDKRKVTSPEELQRLFQSSGKIYADEALIEDTSKEDIDPLKFNDYFLRAFKKNYDEIDHSLESLLEKLHLSRKGKLNLAGLLLFGKQPSLFRPAFIIKAVSFFGDSSQERLYRNSEDIEGDLKSQFKDGMAFLLRNIRKTQQGQPFNSLGIPEVAALALEELLQNAIIHRDYLKIAPVRLFIFDSRIEIISPGKLPNSLNIENIKHGNSAIRNPLIASFAAKLLPYRGLGLGIINALKVQPDIEFYNDEEGEQFKVVIPRPKEEPQPGKHIP